jgi:hypothetical protein
MIELFGKCKMCNLFYIEIFHSLQVDDNGYVAFLRNIWLIRLLQCTSPALICGNVKIDLVITTYMGGKMSTGTSITTTC